jgi:hypothetical protein
MSKSVALNLTDKTYKRLQLAAKRDQRTVRQELLYLIEQRLPYLPEDLAAAEAELLKLVDASKLPDPEEVRRASDGGHA